MSASSPQAAPAADPRVESMEQGKAPVPMAQLQYRSNNKFTTSQLRKQNNWFLSWRNLTYEVDVEMPRDPAKTKSLGPITCPPAGLCLPKGRKKVLTNVAGYVQPGQLLAIIGPSGSGKTTLLNVLAQRTDGGHLSGELQLSGQPYGLKPRNKALKKISSYVLQDDILFAHLTVRETLLFSAKLRMPRSTPTEELKSRVDAIIEELSLGKVANMKIGNEQVRGISGGERKRVAIANELMNDPSILFLDEPTSGLDSFTALNVVSTLDTLARNNHAIVCTIHQPRHNIFEMFHMLMILSGGEVVYFGPASGAVAYFSSLNYPCPRLYNPPDFFLDLVTRDRRTPEADETSSRRIQQLTDAFKASPMATDAARMPTGSAPGHLPSRDERPSWLKQFFVLCHRSALNAYRNPGLTFARVGQGVFTGLLYGFTFYQIGYSSRDVQNRRGAIFLVLIATQFSSIFGILNIFPMERIVYWRERGAGTYGSLAYFLSKNLVEIPATIMGSSIFVSLAYWIMGFYKDAGRFFTFLLLANTLALCAESLTYFIVCLLPQRTFATVLNLLVLVLFIMFSGFYLNASNTPPYFIWVPPISYMRYAFEAGLITQLTGVVFDCGRNMTNVTATMDPTLTVDPTGVPTNITGPVCVFPTGESVLQNLQFSTDYNIVWRNFGIMVAMIFIWRTLAWLALKFIKPRDASTV